jgi:hypothetical protein
MKALRSFHLLACALMLSLLAACTSLGLQAPQSVEDRLQYGKASVSAAYRTLGDAVAARTVGVEQAGDYFKRLEGVEHQLRLAESLARGGKPTDAQSTITLALNALVLIRTELASKQKGA